MRYYCPNCWHDVWNEDFDICPACGYSKKEDSEKDYVKRVINALKHPAGEISHLAVAILEQRREKQAIPYLEKLAKESKDPSLAKAAEKAVEEINGCKNGKG
jgi:rubrerythrin